MAAPKRILARSRPALVAAFFFSGCINVLMLATPLYTLQVFERVIPTASFDTLFLLSGILGTALLALALLEIARDRVLSRVGHRLDRQLSAFVLRRSLEVGTPAADVEAQARAVTAIRGTLTSSGINAVFDAPWTPLFIFVLFLLHFWLGVVTLIAAGLLIVAALLQGLVQGGAQRELTTAIQRSDAWRTAMSVDTRLATALGFAPAAKQRAERLVDDRLYNSVRLLERSAIVKSLARLVRLSAQAAIFGVGAALVMLGEVGAGALIAASILMGRALAPLEQAVNSLRAVRAMLGAVKLLKAVPADDDPANANDRRRVAAGEGARHNGLLRLVGVTAYHPGHRMPVVRNVTLEVAQGACVAVIGPNGSGKSSLLAVAAGAVAPAVGAVELDGVPVGTWQLESARPRIGYLGEDPNLVSGTVAENIARFQAATPLDIAETSQAAGVHDILTGLAGGFETDVGDDGRRISPRERRAVALARALFGAPDVVILDAPENGLDRRADRRLAACIGALRGAGRTLLIATQRPDLMLLADQIVVMNNGTIERTGPARQVLEALGAAPREKSATPHAASDQRKPMSQPLATQDPRATQARIAVELTGGRMATSDEPASQANRRDPEERRVG